MTIKKYLRQHVGKKAARRIYKAMPWVGGAVALAAGDVVRRRGLRRVVDDVRGFVSSVGERTSS
jgi:hypothetical protein